MTIVHGVIERYLHLEPSQKLADRPDSTRLGEDLGIDSLTMLEIVVSIEEALDFRIEDSEARSIRTLGDVRRYVEDRVHGRPVTLKIVESYDRARICLILAQQPPFLFVDRAEIEADELRASYTFTGEESFFAGHFKDDPIVPASILYEAMGQAASLWVLERVPARLQLTLPTNHVLFVGLEQARISRRAKPHDTIDFKLKMVRLRQPLAIFNGHAEINGQIVAKIDELILAFGDFNPATFDATPAQVTPQREAEPSQAEAVVNVV